MRKAVAGLGNPGARYERTRHNAGFLVVDALARKHGVALAGPRHGAVWGEVVLGEQRLLLIEPQGYMNRSGLAVSAFAREFELDPSDILVVHDELDLPLARIKLKRGGGTAGHRGLESIVEQLGTREFPRLRVGIGRPPAGGEVVDFVLEPLSDEERTALQPALEAAVAGVEAWCLLGTEGAMGMVNAPRASVPGEAPGAEGSLRKPSSPTS